MEFHNQRNVDCGKYCNNQYDTSDGYNNLASGFKHSPRGMNGNSDPYCNFWVHSYSGSYAMDARIRLETLKSGSSSPVPTMNESLYSYDFSKDIWEIGQNELSVLDSVDLIDVDGEEDEERWLYVSPKEFVEKTESALKWSRHVLDNRSPEMEAACVKMINRLNLNHSCHDKSLHSNYKLQNITDVYDVARMQEASLRQENVYTPRHPESPLAFPPCTNTSATNANDKHRKEASSCRASMPLDQLTRITTDKNCLSPKVTRLHQYKMLKRAHNEGSSSRSSSPMRTSLRSLQAVRSSRSLDIDDYSLDQIICPRSTHHLDSDELVRPAAIKRCQRSYSLSPCRIPHPSISSMDSVFSPLKNLRGATWLRSGRLLQR